MSCPFYGIVVRIRLYVQLLRTETCSVNYLKLNLIKVTLDSIITLCIITEWSWLT